MWATLAASLILAIFVHVATCPPCFDNVCASARTDGSVVKLPITTATDLRNSGDGNSAHPFAALLSGIVSAPIEESLPAGSKVRACSLEPLHRNSALAHRESVVLLT